VPASRAFSKGYLKLSFVSCPVALYPAPSAAERLSFRQVNRRTGHRLKHKLVDSITGESVDSSNKARGYEIGENKFLLVEDRDLEHARGSGRRPARSRSTMHHPMKARRRYPPRRTSRMRKSLPRSMTMATRKRSRRARVRRTRTRSRSSASSPQGRSMRDISKKPYYIAPRQQIGQESFAVIRDAVRREGVIGLARVVLSSRERYFLVEPMDNGLRGVALRFAQEVRGADDYFREIPEIKLPAEMMNLAQHIIRTKSDKFDPAMLEDHYRTALVRILRKKQEKRPAHHTPVMQPPRENVVSVMDALRRSIPAERPAGREKRAASKGAARHRKAS
jgi:DNA end-binding protein Ku